MVRAGAPAWFLCRGSGHLTSTALAIGLRDKRPSVAGLVAHKRVVANAMARRAPAPEVEAIVRPSATVSERGFWQ